MEAHYGFLGIILIIVGFIITHTATGSLCGRTWGHAVT